MIKITNAEMQSSLCLNLETKDFSKCPISFESGNKVKDGVNYWFTKGECSKCGIIEETEDTYENSLVPYNSLNVHLAEINETLKDINNAN